MKNPSNKWAFRPRFRARAFSWRGSKLAAQRMKEAVSEIKAVSRKAPESAAEGAILLMEKLWPALEQVDSSSGALGNAVNKTVHELLDIIVATPIDEGLREPWLERLWTAMEEDGVEFLWEVSERWGELCGSQERASRAADELLPTVRLSWSTRHGGYFRSTPACLSCLLAAGRYRELLDLIDTAPYLSWHYRRYGVQALAAMGRPDEAIAYAGTSLGLNDTPAAIAQACESILIATGRHEEAYRRYALETNRSGSHLATFRAIKKKYQAKAPREILDDLIANSPGEEGKWFATAKTFGFFDIASELARRSPVDIGTLIRAARDHVDKKPEFALEAATAALLWMAQGQFYEITSRDVLQATEYALKAAAAVGRVESTRKLLHTLIDSRDTDGFVREQLTRHFDALSGR